jgi:integrase
MKYKIKRILHCSGERMVIICDLKTGVPLFYPTLYSTTNLRNTKGGAFSTIRGKLESIKKLLEIADHLHIDLESRFVNGDWLSNCEIELICYWLKVKKFFFDNALVLNSRVKITNKIINLIPRKKEDVRIGVQVDSPDTLSSKGYSNITQVGIYMDWLAKKVFNSGDGGRMQAWFYENRGFKPHNKQEELARRGIFDSLTEAQEINMLDTVRPSCHQNPWKQQDLKVRNQLIVNLLLEIGCRRGESLNIKTTDLVPIEYLDERSDLTRSGEKARTLSGMAINVWRDPDNAEDPRLDQPRVKTLSRTIEIEPQLAEMIENYVINHRANVPGANKCPYLFISHQRGCKKAVPMSLSGIDKVFIQLTNKLGFKVKIHGIRRTWNDRFSEENEAAIENKEISYDEIEDARSWLQGWKAGSGSARFYTRRSQYNKAIRKGLDLQKSRVKKQNQIVGSYDDDIGM